MGRFGKKEPKLNEVKAVLQRLQGFPEEEKPSSSQSATNSKGSPRSRSVVATTIVIGQAAALLVGVFLFVKFMTPIIRQAAVVGTEPLKLEAAKASLEVARGLMAKGQVQAAREQLIALARKG